MSWKVLIMSGLVLYNGAVPFAQKATTFESPNTVAVTVVGCLQLGAEPGTFLLTNVRDPLVDPLAISVGGIVPTVTYQLSGEHNLANHVGQRIEVTGKTARQPTATATLADSRSQHKEAVGTTGTKIVVKEKAQMIVRSLDIDSVNGVRGPCAKP